MSETRAVGASRLDALDEAGEHRARADLQERIITCCIQGAHGLRESGPARRAAAAAARRSRRSRNRRCRPRRTPGPACATSVALELGAQRRRAPTATSGEWKAPLTASGMTRLAPAVLAFSASSLQSGLAAAHHDLAGAVEVGRPDAVLLGAERLDDVVVQADDGRHAAGVGVGGAQHLLAAPPHEAQRVVERHRAGRDQRRVLAQAVPDGDVEAQALGCGGCGRCRRSWPAAPAA